MISILFLSSLIYASVVFHRQRRSTKNLARSAVHDNGLHNATDLENFGSNDPPQYTYSNQPYSGPSPAEVSHDKSNRQGPTEAVGSPVASEVPGSSSRYLRPVQAPNRSPAKTQKGYRADEELADRNGANEAIELSGEWKR